MKLNAGIVTRKLDETRKFYTEALDFGITFENEFYLLLHTPDRKYELSFLLPNHPSQAEIFRKEFTGEGVYLTIEVDNVDGLYEKLKRKGIKIHVDIREEVWGDRHFAVLDPNGVGIDFVTFQQVK